MTAAAGANAHRSTPASSRRAIRIAALGHRFTYGGREQRILDGVALSIECGESVALIGRSGSGKSTLLNLIGGLEPLQHGSIEVFNQSLGELDDRARTLLRRRSIGYVHQAFNLIPTLSVGDNILLPLALAGASLRERRHRLTTMLEAIGLPDRAEDYPDRLSGGEQQRVAIARALVHAPPLLLADEPTGNLDADSGRRVLDLLVTLVRERNAAMLIVTHSLEVARVADRALSLHAGALEPVDADTLAAGGAW